MKGVIEVADNRCSFVPVAEAVMLPRGTAQSFRYANVALG